MEKEKLKELLRDCLGQNIAIIYDTPYDYTSIDYDKITEYLLNNGIVSPPVNIGDKVWYIEGGYYNAPYMRPKEIEVTEINKKKSGKSIDWGFIANKTRYRFSSFGKTVFWTEAECKTAIEEKKQNKKGFKS